jgi:hypothetical protein
VWLSPNGHACVDLPLIMFKDVGIVSFGYTSYVPEQENDLEEIETRVVRSGQAGLSNKIPLARVHVFLS